MKISTRGGSLIFELLFEFDNAIVTKNVKVAHYEKLPDGRRDFTKRAKYDISASALDEFSNALTEMLNARVDHYDAPELIRVLVSKLSPSQFNELVKEGVLAEEIE